VLVSDDGRLTGFGEFPRPGGESPRAPLMFTGIHIMEPAIFDYIPRGVPSGLGARRLSAGNGGGRGDRRACRRGIVERTEHA
jgi:NDP-sugar pyrophosphorylase family protein